MSDHWNSLANLLGTPNLKPHGKKGAAEEVAPVAESVPVDESQPRVEAKGGGSKPAKGSAKGDEAKAKRIPRRGKKADAAQDFAKEVIVEEEPAASVASGDLVGIQDVEVTQELESPEVSSSDELTEKPVSVLRSSWDAVANFFGMGSGSESPEQRSERTPEARRSSESSRGRKTGRSEDRDRGVDQREKVTEVPEGRSDQRVLASDGPVDRRGERRPPRRGAAQRTDRTDGENDTREDLAKDIVKDDSRANRTDRGDRPSRDKAFSERGSERDDQSLERDDRRLESDDRRSERADRRPERDDRRPERDDRRPERADRGSERNDRRPERDDRRPERDDRRPERADRRPERADRKPERDDRKPERADRKPERDDRRLERNDRRPERESRPVELGFGGGLDDFEVSSKDESGFGEGFDKGDFGRSEQADGRGESRKGRVNRRDRDRDQRDRDQVGEGDRRRRSEVKNDSRSEPRDSEEIDSFEGSSAESDDREDTRVRAGRIPSWEETVAVLIEANVANHRKTPSGPNRSRRGRPNS